MDRTAGASQGTRQTECSRRAFSAHGSSFGGRLREEDSLFRDGRSNSATYCFRGRFEGSAERDIDIATEILDNDPQVKASLLRRGLNIPGRLSASVKMLNETIGDDPSLSNIHSRLIRFLFLSDQDAANQFSPVVDGVIAIVDLYE
jgi:hypothetical protein